jgi:hypothetical protein
MESQLEVDKFEAVKFIALGEHRLPIDNGIDNRAY